MYFKILTLVIFLSASSIYGQQAKYRQLQKAQSGMIVYRLGNDNKYEKVKISTVVNGTNMVGIYTKPNQGVIVAKDKLYEKIQESNLSEQEKKN